MGEGGIGKARMGWQQFLHVLHAMLHSRRLKN